MGTLANPEYKFFIFLEWLNNKNKYIDNVERSAFSNLSDLSGIWVW